MMERARNLLPHLRGYRHRWIAGVRLQPGSVQASPLMKADHPKKNIRMTTISVSDAPKS
jgi:hypothetical protein